MKNLVPPPEDERLRSLLRESRAAPPLPPRFQESVWRRIESGEVPRDVRILEQWLDSVAAWVLRPRLALAGVAAMLLIGIAIGALQADRAAEDIAKHRYVAAVSPLTVH
jgi:hypothetical protein